MSEAVSRNCQRWDDVESEAVSRHYQRWGGQGISARLSAGFVCDGVGVNSDRANASWFGRSEIFRIHGQLLQLIQSIKPIYDSVIVKKNNTVDNNLILIFDMLIFGQK